MSSSSREVRLRRRKKSAETKVDKTAIMPTMVWSTAENLEALPVFRTFEQGQAYLLRYFVVIALTAMPEHYLVCATFISAMISAL